MKIRVMRTLGVFNVLFFLGCAGSLWGNPQVQTHSPKKNMINKVLHHKSSMDALELGQVVMCFTQEPTVERVPKKIIDHSVEMVFFFPATKINGAAHGMVKKLNADSKATSLYQVSVKETAQGTKLIITYDPKKVSIESDSFVNIDCLKGLVFRLYNKELLDSLQKSSGSLLRTASITGKHSIVIDCGHGGTDTGTISASHLSEKQVALNVGLQVASLLRHEGFDVLLTRDSDVNVDLDERTTLANLKRADMFVSIHANSAPRATVSGIETFCLNDALFSTGFTDSDPKFSKAVHALMHDRNNDSIKLAECLQRNTLASVKKKHASVVNRNVKNAVAQVLCGATMPSALIEIGFLSNSYEAELLANKDFCHVVAQGISNGVVEYAARRVA